MAEIGFDHGGIVPDCFRRPFGDLLAADKRVTEHLDSKAIAALLDPTKYIGLCAVMAHDAAARARHRAKECASGSADPVQCSGN